MVKNSVEYDDHAPYRCLLAQQPRQEFLKGGGVEDRAHYAYELAGAQANRAEARDGLARRRLPQDRILDLRRYIASGTIMNQLPKSLPADKALADSLIRALDKSERITGIVEECAAELSSVNSTLKDQLSSQGTHPGVLRAIEKNEGIENKMHDCAEDLTTVIEALEEEVKVRHELEDQLHATTEQAETARHAALHDTLTSLPNRALFNDRIEHGMALARRHGWTLAVLFIDLNNFKGINDSYGHSAGDQMLQAIGTRLKSAMRADDTVSRHGGDEFLYLLLEVKNDSDAEMVAHKIIKTICEPCD